MNGMKAAIVIGLIMLLVLPACADQISLSYILPSAGFNNGSVSIIDLHGANFTINAKTSLNNGATTIMPTGTVFITPTQIECVFNLVGSPAGLYNVTVYDNTNLSNNATLPNGFTIFNPPPVLTTIVPPSGVNTGTVPFVLNGTGLILPGSTVNLSKSGSNITATGLSQNINGSFSGNFDLTPAANGTWNVTWENIDGNVSNPLPFMVNNPAPTISNVVPVSGTNSLGNTNYAVSIFGSNFINGATVQVNQGLHSIPISAGPTWINQGRINTALNLFGVPVGSYNVTVINPDNQNVTSINAFRVFYPAAPGINNITPSTGVNTGTITTLIGGSEFHPGAMVTLNRTSYADIPATNIVVNNISYITCDLPIAGAVPGIWNIVVSNNDTQWSSFSGFTITAPPAPVASFATNTTSGNAPLTVQFTDTTTNNPTSWNWNFGDGNTSILQNTTHTFGVGTWLVQLNASNPYGSNTTVPGTTITVGSPPPPPVVNFTASPTSGFAPLYVQFMDTSSANITSWNWNLDTASNISASAQNPSFTYNQPGNYSVSLTVTNTSGTATTVKSDFIIVTTKPVANFDGSPLSGTIPLAVQFMDNSTNSSTSWHWDFGDGANSTLKNPNHTYTTGGTFTVTLITDNAGGNSDPFVRTNYVTALPPVPVANPLANVTSGLLPLTVQFTDNSTDTPTTFLWNFGDNSTSADKDPVHTFAVSGIYNVSEYVSNVAGNSTGYVTVQVNSPPAANFTASPTAGFKPLTVQFNDTSMSNITAWQWMFGPDSFSAGSPNPMFTYNEVGVFTVNLTVTNASGMAMISRPAFITVTSKPVADFNASPTTGIIPLMVQFNDTSTDATGWLWNFGDNTSSTLQNPSHLYNATGHFSVTLTASNAGGNGEPVTKTNYISVTIPPPAADFTATPVKGDIPLNVQFTDVSTGNPTAWNWNFGDGNTSTLESPSHTYVTVGVYNVSLEAINAGGNNITTRNSLINATQPRPVAHFAFNTSGGTIPFDVSFIDQSTNNPTGWQWNFGDGGTSVLQNPVHRFTAAGNYTVTMRASNSGGVSNNTAFTNIIAVLPPPVANFTATPLIGTVPVTVQFTDLSTNHPATWVWNFGDGTLAGPNIQNPVHTYNKVGSFNVSLTVVNSGGSATLIRPAYITATNAPIADFTATPTSGLSPLVVRFTDKSSGKPFLFYWQFGDGMVSTDKNPTHVYQKAGNYTVTETVQNFAGSGKKTRQSYIVVSSMPQAAFTASPTSGLAPLEVQFTDTSSGTPTSWAWSFGDNTTSTSQNPVHTYIVGGLYSVQLTVTNGVGSNTVTKTQLVSVNTPLNADFTYMPAQGNVPLTVQFTDTSTGNPFSYTWTFGDNIASTEHNPVHTYLKPGVYNVTLSILSTQGSGKISKQVTVTNIPVAHFKAVPLNGSVPLTVQFTDTSANNPLTWFWSFGDGQFSEDHNPSHTYNAPGQYSVALTVTNDDGSDELVQSKMITVKSFP